MKRLQVESRFILRTQLIKMPLPVLIEEIGDDGLGREFSPEYLHVRCPAEQEDVGRIVFAEIYAAEDHGLMGHSPGKE